MGNTVSPTHDAAGVLFSPVQARLLGMLFAQPERRFQSAELIRAAASGTGAAHRQLRKMVDAGLLGEIRLGNQVHYQANRNSPVFDELHRIVLKTIGLAQPLGDALSPLRDGILSAFVFGSLAKGTARGESDVDLMVISDQVDYTQVFEALQSVEQILARRVNPTVMSIETWRHKRTTPDSFVARIAAEPKLWVIGSDDDLA